METRMMMREMKGYMERRGGQGEGKTVQCLNQVDG